MTTTKTSAELADELERIDTEFPQQRQFLLQAAAILRSPAPIADGGVRKALEFYADPFVWKKKNDPDDVVRIPDFYSETSFGDTAQVALASLASPAQAVQLPCPVCGGEAIHAIDVLKRTVINNTLAPIADGGVRSAAQYVVDKFKKDEAQGYHTRDREFAITILDKALAFPTATPDRERIARIIAPEAFEPSYRHYHPDRSTVEGYTAFKKADAILSLLSAPQPVATER